MQNLSLVLLLLAMASMVFALDMSAFAQETPADSTETVEGESEDLGEEAMEEELDEELADEEAMDDATDEELADDMEVTMMEDDDEEEQDDVDSPREQLMSGIDPHEIQCGAGLKLVFKASNFQPSCIKESSYEVLLQRGWASAHDPTHEELTAMMDKLKPAEDEMDDAEDDVMEETEDDVMDETEDDTMEEELEEEIEEEETSGDEPIPQSHSVELSESVGIAAN